MPRAAVAAAARSADAGKRAPDKQTEDLLASLGRQLGYGRRFRPNRNHFALLAVLVLGFWVVLGFGRTITQLNAATERASELRLETSALADRLAAGERELELVQTDAFQALQARAYGIGGPAEVPFALEDGAPDPPPVVPLGSRAAPIVEPKPLDAWLGLLFGD